MRKLPVQLHPNKGFTLISPERGFTLIELLVTIAIIAIISVVAVALFGNIQADARDGKRRAELESIANALEVNKSNTGGPYNPLLATYFAGGSFPGSSATATDPQGYPYCVASSLTITPPATNAVVANFVSSPIGCTGVGGTAGYTVISGAQPANTTVSWKICTRLESKGTPSVFCRTNAQ